MPTYEFRCPKCLTVHEDVRRVKQRNRPFYCECEAEYRRIRCERILSVPHTAAWNDQEIFPNLHGYDDLNDVPGGMQFESRAAYDKYLVDEDIREIGTPRSGGDKHDGLQIYRFGKKEKPPPAPGSW